MLSKNKNISDGMEKLALSFAKFNDGMAEAAKLHAAGIISGAVVDSFCDLRSRERAARGEGATVFYPIPGIGSPVLLAARHHERRRYAAGTRIMADKVVENIRVTGHVMAPDLAALDLAARVVKTFTRSDLTRVLVAIEPTPERVSDLVSVAVSEMIIADYEQPAAHDLESRRSMIAECYEAENAAHVAHVVATFTGTE